MDQLVDLNGIVDLHTHCGPSIFSRRVDGHELALKAAEAGMDGVVMKEHHFPTIHGAHFINRYLDEEGIDLSVFGSTVLNYCNGGFNPFIVEATHNYDGKVIWAPTIDARHHAEVMGSLGTFLDVEETANEYEDKEGITATAEDGELRKEVKMCLDKIMDYGMAFFVGHMSYEEILAMAQYCEDYDKFVIDHPYFPVTDLSLDQQETLSSLGSYINLPFSALNPGRSWASPGQLYESIRRVGVDNCVLTSDVGQLGNPDAPDAMRMLGEQLIQEGLSNEEFRVLAEANPKDILDLE